MKATEGDDMQTFRLEGDNKHLYFRNYERRSGREELAEIMQILTGNGFEVKDKLMGPDCDLYTCQGNGLRFAICANIEGDGSTICVEDEYTLECLERIFEKGM